MPKKEPEAKTVLERVYNVPLRKEFMKAPKWNRSKKAVKALREFIAKHMKADKVLIGKYANQFVWRDGIKNPPHHVKVKASKDDKNVVKIELVELSAKAQREIKKAGEAEKESKEKKARGEKEKKEAKEKKEEKMEEKVAEVKEEKAEKAKEMQKEGIKELKKEQPKQPAQKQPAIPKRVEQRPTAPKSV